MVHSISGYARCAGKTVRARAIPERLRGVITTRRYTNPRLPLPLSLPIQAFKDLTITDILYT